MSRIATTLISALTVCLVGSGVVVAADDDAALEAVRAKIGAMFDEIEPQHVNASPVEGWYTVQKGSIVAYVSKDGRYLLQGDLIDLDRQVNLTEQSRTSARRQLMSTVGDDKVILFSPADLKYTVTVFTDVACTYCRQLHSQIDEYMTAGIAIRYMLYPRHGPGSASWATSEKVWCAKDRNLALTAAKLDRAFETQKCDSSVIADHYQLGQEAGLNGTPAIVLADGTLISGYLPPAALSLRLQQAATK